MNKWIGQNKKAVEKIRARMRKKARAESAEARAADERVRDYDKQEG